MYLDLASGELYGPKMSGSWPVVGVDLRGPAGPIGPQGVGLNILGTLADEAALPPTATLPTNGTSLPGATTRHRSYFQILTGTPPATRTIDMGDNGVNALQIASIIFG
jgi:hypothetical protein